MKPNSQLPRHIAIIMDGNGRWAKKRGLPRLFGHRAGIAAVKRTVRECSRLGVGVLTLYAFSSENWSRPEREVKGLMSLLKGYLGRELDSLLEEGVRLRTIGDISRLPEDAREVLETAARRTEKNAGLVLNLALNYGGRQEILSAVNALLEAGAGPVDEKTFEKQLYTAGLPDPDLLIRTSGELRLSNFLLWQSAYTEFYFTPVLWPDFDEKSLAEALAHYGTRERRFGGVGTGGSTPADAPGKR